MIILVYKLSITQVLNQKTSSNELQKHKTILPISMSIYGD